MTDDDGKTKVTLLYELDSYMEDFTSLRELKQWIEELESKVPPEHRDDIAFLYEAGWQGDAGHIEICYYRPKTDEDRANERREKEAHQRRVRRLERETYERLKEKFEKPKRKTRR